MANGEVPQEDSLPGTPPSTDGLDINQLMTESYIEEGRSGEEIESSTASEARQILKEQHDELYAQKETSGPKVVKATGNTKIFANPNAKPVGAPPKPPTPPPAPRTPNLKPSAGAKAQGARPKAAARPKGAVRARPASKKTKPAPKQKSSMTPLLLIAALAAAAYYYFTQG